MRVLATCIAVTVAVACGAGPAEAQTQNTPAVSYKRFGQCMYKRDPVLADKFLANSDAFAVRESVVGNWSQLGQKLVTGCLPDAISTSLDVRLIRDLLAEEAYTSHIKVFVDAAPTPARQRIRSGNPKSRAFSQISDCFAEKGGAAADALVRSAPGTPAESAEMDRLKPTVIACVGETTAPSLTTFSVRRLAAEGLWVRFLGLDPANADWKVAQ